MKQKFIAPILYAFAVVIILFGFFRTGASFPDMYFWSGLLVYSIGGIIDNKSCKKENP